MIPRDTALVLEFHASIALPDRAPARVFALLDGDGPGDGRLEEQEHEE